MLRHRRIYILPTRRGLAFLATLAMMLLTSLNYALSLGFVVDVPAVGLVGCGAAAHVPQSRRHRAAAARRRRDLRRRRRCRSRSPLAGGALRARAVIARRARVRAGRRSTCRPTARCRSRSSVPAPRRGRLAARARHAVLRLSAGTVARLGVRPLPAGRHRVSGARAARAAAAAGRRGDDAGSPSARRRRRPRRAAQLPARRPAAARRVEGGRARRRLVHQAVRRRRRRRPGRRSTGARCRPTLDAEARLARLTAWVLAAERAARPFALRLPGRRAAGRPGPRPPPRRADGAGAVPGRMTARGGRPAQRRARRAPAPTRCRRPDPLARRAAARGAAAAVPYVPVLGRRLGMTLVGAAARCCVAPRPPAPGTPPARIRRWCSALLALVAAVAIRASFGYFLGRDPCVAFLFVLVGIKFLEARTARDGTLLVCLASFLIVTPFFYSQSLLAALAAVPARAPARRRAAGARAAAAGARQRRRLARCARRRPA